MTATQNIMAAKQDVMMAKQDVMTAKLKGEVSSRWLHFKQPATTSRGTYTALQRWIIVLSDGQHCGMGECAPLPDLSCDFNHHHPELYMQKLTDAVNDYCASGAINYEALRDYPSMLFGLETAVLTLQNGGNVLFDTPFCRGEEGIPINGLVWMGSYDEMVQRIEEKLAQGYRCVKLKIGSLDFESDLSMVKRIRQRFSFHDVELRLDANGAYTFDEALYKLELLSQYAIHSIEQPIKAGQWAFMAELCRNSPLPIALDEELIGVNDPEQKRQMLNIIKPRYIILKPSLHGGMMGCREWIDIARDSGIGSWMTSALESNIGLNAIAQLAADVYGPHITMPQGLGTGQLFTDNVAMSLEVRANQLWRTEFAE